jgi:hypothetical protein
MESRRKASRERWFGVQVLIRSWHTPTAGEAPALPARHADEQRRSISAKRDPG